MRLTLHLILTGMMLSVMALACCKPAATPPSSAVEMPPPASYKDATYQINGRSITLINGVYESETAPGSASRIITRSFGNDAVGDLNGDGKDDVAVLLIQDTGGSGAFYYVAAALRTAAGYQGTNGILLGDRIAPQTTKIENALVIVNYAERKHDEPFSTKPSVGVSKYLKVIDGKLVEVNPR